MQWELLTNYIFDAV